MPSLVHQLRACPLAPLPATNNQSQWLEKSASARLAIHISKIHSDLDLQNRNLIPRHRTDRQTVRSILARTTFGANASVVSGGEAQPARPPCFVAHVPSCRVWIGLG
jgi:hypothetical protein